MNAITRLREQLEDILWRRTLSDMPGSKRLGLYVVRVSFAVGRDVAEGQLTLRAMSLVYTTLLSLVPLLAISFSVLKGFGVHNQVEPLLLNLLAPLGEQGVQITGRIIGFVENIKVGVLGGLGLALLFYTVVSLMQKIERSFNYIWHVRRERTFVQRFRDYLSVIIVGPVLVFSGIGLMASAMSTPVYESMAAIQPFGTLIEFAARLVPFLLIVGAFTFINVFVPNTGVRLRSALIGGAVAGLLWHTTGWLFASFVASSTNYAAIYSTFATLIIFLVWVYLGWLIMLIGAAIAFYDQYPEQIAVPHERLVMSNRSKEKLALLAATTIARGFLAEHPPPSLEALCQALDTPGEATAPILETLEAAGIIARTGEDPAGYMPARPPERIRVGQILDAIRCADETRRIGLGRRPADRAVDNLLAELSAATVATLGERTLQDLAEAGSRPAEPAALSPVQMPPGSAA